MTGVTFVCLDEFVRPITIVTTTVRLASYMTERGELIELCRAILHTRSM